MGGKSSSEGRIRVYYAHPIFLYDTDEEKNALGVIQKHLHDVDILNPKKYDEDPEFSKQKKAEGMEFCFRLIDSVDYLVFQCFAISSDFKEFTLDYLTHADEYKGQLNSLARKQEDVLHNLIQNRKIVTPGVDKEIEYALNCSKCVYEVQGQAMKQITKKPEYAVLPRGCYRTFSILLRAYRSKSSHLLFPPFWWLER